MNRLDNSPVFIALFIFTLTSYLFSTLAFIVSQWYSMFPGSMSDFQNIGLWEVCFNSFMNEDIYDKLYSDCFYIGSSDISDLYNWIVTKWFLACQVIYTLSYISLMIATLVCTLMCFGLLNMRHIRNVIILISLHFISWVTCFATLILFGVNTKNLSENQWMPKPTQCTLSWSYGSASLSLLATMISLGLLFFVLKSNHKGLVIWNCGKNRYEKETFPNQIEMESHSMIGPSIYDPRGNSSASKISAERDRSLISSRLEPSHRDTSKRENQPEKPSNKSNQQRPHLEKSSKRENQPEKPSNKSNQQRPHLEKSSKFTKNNARANVPKYFSNDKTSRSQPQKSSVISERPSSNLYIKQSKPAHSDASMASEKSISRADKPVKISSPTGSQLTITSRTHPQSSSIVIAAKPMKKI